MCLVSRSDNIWVTRFGVKVQYKHIVVLAQINLNDYSFYSFHPILIKLCTNDYWANALWNRVRIRSLTPGGPGGALKWVNKVKFQNATPPLNIQYI